MSNVIVSVKPQFGINYDVGYVGFTFTDNSFVSNGIAWFSRWDKGENPDVPVLNISHTFIVSGENECIEAINPQVSRSPLTKYFNNPHVHLSFRKPTGLTTEIAAAMISDAANQIGKHYDYSLIVGHAIDDTILGHLLSDITHEKSKEFLTWLFESKGRFICSELISTVMNNRTEYAKKGELIHPPYSVNPQELFQSREIFSPWTEEIQGERYDA